MKNIKTYIFVTFILILISSCYQYPESSDLEYDKYNRVIGPEGGEIVFLSNYSNDSLTDLALKLEFPAGAVDSNFVFNMYEFEDVDLVQKMKNEGLAIIGSKQLYLVPFYESEGYNEHGQLDLAYHLSVDFKEPVSATYNYLNEDQAQSSEWQENQLYYEFYKKTTKLYELYKIKIPRIDEWGDNNVFVAWNDQKYPVGYDESHLHNIISGEMSATNPDGSGEESLLNWELVSEFNIDTKLNQVTFDIYDTDHIYVLALKIEVDPSQIPRAITNLVKQAFPTATIEKASMDLNDKIIHLYLSNDFIFIVERREGLTYVIKSELEQDEIPEEINDIIAADFPGEQIRNVAYNTINDWETYTVSLTSGEKLYFDASLNLSGVYKYGIDPSQLPEPILSQINEKFPNQAVTNVTYDAEDSQAQAIVYLSNDVKLAFNTADFSLVSEIHFHLTESDIPDEIRAFLEENEPGVQISSIQYYVEPGTSGKNFMAELINGSELVFKTDYSLLAYETNFFPEENLPQSIQEGLANYAPMEVSQISRIFYEDPDEGTYSAYDIQLSGGLNIYYEDDKIAFMEGTNFDQTPAVNSNFIKSLLPDAQILVFYYYPNADGVSGQYEYYLNTGVIIGIDNNNTIIFYETENFELHNLPSQMQDIISDEAPGLSLVNFWYDEADAENAWNAQLVGERHIVLRRNFSLLLMQDFDVTEDDLPASIFSYVLNNYQGSRADNFIKQFSAEYNKVVYEINLNSGETLFFDAFGSFIESSRQVSRTLKTPFKTSKFKIKDAFEKKSSQINRFKRN